MIPCSDSLVFLFYGMLFGCAVRCETSFREVTNERTKTMVRMTSSAWASPNKLMCTLNM